MIRIQESIVDDDGQWRENSNVPLTRVQGRGRSCETRTGSIDIRYLDLCNTVFDVEDDGLLMIVAAPVPCNWVTRLPSCWRSYHVISGKLERYETLQNYKSSVRDSFLCTVRPSNLEGRFNFRSRVPVINHVVCTWRCLSQKLVTGCHTAG